MGEKRTAQKMPASCPTSIRGLPAQAPEAHPAVHVPSLPLLPHPNPEVQNASGRERRVSGGGNSPGPKNSSGKQLQAERNKWPHLIPGSISYGPDSDHRGAGTWRRALVACSTQVGLGAWAWSGGVSGRGERAGAGKGFPVFRPWPVSPVAPRQQQERGGGSS